MQASDLKHLKEIEQELSQFKRMYADMALENRALKDLKVGDPVQLKVFVYHPLNRLLAGDLWIT